MSRVWQKLCFPWSQYYRKQHYKKDCVQDNSYVYIYKANIQPYYQQETWLHGSNMKSPLQNNITTVGKYAKTNTACS